MDTKSILEFINNDSVVYFAISNLIDRDKVFLCQETEFTPKMIVVHGSAVDLLRDNLPGITILDIKDEPRENFINRLLANSFPLR